MPLKTTAVSASKFSAPWALLLEALDKLLDEFTELDEVAGLDETTELDEIAELDEATELIEEMLLLLEDERDEGELGIEDEDGEDVLLACEELEELCAASLEGVLDTDDSGALETRDDIELLDGLGELVLGEASPDGAAPPQLASHSERLMSVLFTRNWGWVLLSINGPSLPSFFIARKTATFNSRT